MKAKTVLSNILNILFFIELVVFVVIAILYIWVDDTSLMIKLLESDTVAMIFTLFFYWLFFYNSEKYT